MQKVVFNNNVVTFADDILVLEINAAGTNASGATGLVPPANFERVVFVVTRVDDNNRAVAFFGLPTVAQEIEIHPVGGEIEVFATKFDPSPPSTFLDGSTSFTTTLGASLRGVVKPSNGTLYYSHLG